MRGGRGGREGEGEGEGARGKARARARGGRARVRARGRGKVVDLNLYSLFYSFINISLFSMLYDGNG